MIFWPQGKVDGEHGSEMPALQTESFEGTGNEQVDAARFGEGWAGGIGQCHDRQ
jgi:hypothetical protein